MLAHSPCSPLSLRVRWADGRGLPVVSNFVLGGKETLSVKHRKEQRSPIKHKLCNSEYTKLSWRCNKILQFSKKTTRFSLIDKENAQIPVVSVTFEGVLGDYVFCDLKESKTWMSSVLWANTENKSHIYTATYKAFLKCTLLILFNKTVTHLKHINIFHI